MGRACAPANWLIADPLTKSEQERKYELCREEWRRRHPKPSDQSPEHRAGIPVCRIKTCAGRGNQIGGRVINRLIVLRGYDCPNVHAQILYFQDFSVRAKEPIKALGKPCAHGGTNGSLASKSCRYMRMFWCLDDVRFQHETIDNFILTIGLIPFFQLSCSFQMVEHCDSPDLPQSCGVYLCAGGNLRSRERAEKDPLPYFQRDGDSRSTDRGSPATSSTTTSA